MTGPPEGANSIKGPLSDDIPQSIVARSSKVAIPVKELIKDVRRLMGPYTASNLREKSYNRLKDYLAVSSVLGVSHLITFSQTQNHNVVMKMAKSPQGPTLHFKVNAYSLASDVKSLQKHPFDSQIACKCF